MTRSRKSVRLNSRSRKRAPRQTAQPMAQLKQRAGLGSLKLYLAGGVVAVVIAAFVAYDTQTGTNTAPNVSASTQSPKLVKVGAKAPDITFNTTNGATHRLSLFRGRPVMLWFFASWCPTCKVGTSVVAQNFDRLERSGLQIIQLRLYNNLGYPGPTAEEFAKIFAKKSLSSRAWLWGQATYKASYLYDPRGYPDIYFLIDKAGVIRRIDGVPHATIDKILAFVEGQK